jgi:GNAT superfamily N-acetyltransferase
MTADLTVRAARLDDVTLLAALNRQLIEDQRHHSTATDADLADRMGRWIAGDAYEVALVEERGEPVAYGVWRDDEDGIYVRQFFVVRHRRRAGVGREAFARLSSAWGAAPVKLDALVHNERGLAFWRALGFRDYSVILARDPATS